MSSVEDLIGKCVSGGAARDIIKGIEEELPDLKTVRMHLLNDLNRLGLSINSSDIKVESTCVKVLVSKSLLENRGTELMTICDIYSRTYLGVDILIGSS